MSPENSKERYEELAEKWLNNSITPEEAKEYAAWYNAGQEKGVDIPREFASGDRELRDRILSKVLGQPLPHKAPVRRIWARVAVAAAASVIVVLGLRFFLIRNSSANQQDIGANTNKQQDVSPGGDRAILTLADGSHITLDSAANGQLARQGNANIVKLDKGQLAYNTVYDKNKVSALFNSISTPRGGQYRVVLPDGSKV